MYCYKCGKYIDSGSICSDCAAQENGYATPNQQPQQPQYNAPQYSAPQYSAPQYTAPQYAAPTAAPRQYVSNLPEPNNKMYGFGKALTSTILGFIGLMWVYISMVIITTEISYANSYYDYESAGIALIVLMLCALPLIIIPLIQGISSIKVFTSRKDTCAKPIATLILGISGLSCAAISALINIIMLAVSFSLF